MTVHNEIRIEFELKGRRYEAVGFLEKDEPSVNGDGMLKRTDKDGNVVGEEDYQYILKRRKKLPKALDKYYLATKRPPVFPRYVSCLRWDGNAWFEHWDSLDCQWDDFTLVLR